MGRRSTIVSGSPSPCYSSATNYRWGKTRLVYIKHTSTYTLNNKHLMHRFGDYFCIVLRTRPLSRLQHWMYSVLYHPHSILHAFDAIHILYVYIRCWMVCFSRQSDFVHYREVILFGIQRSESLALYWGRVSSTPNVSYMYMYVWYICVVVHNMWLYKMFGWGSAHIYGPSTLGRVGRLGLISFPPHSPHTGCLPCSQPSCTLVMSPL